MLMAALDGIQTKTRPGDPIDKDVYDLQPEELAGVPSTPRSLEDSLQALRNDHEFLLRGDVFTSDIIDTWIWYKQTREIESPPRPPPPVRVHAVLRRLARTNHESKRIQGGVCSVRQGKGIVGSSGSGGTLTQGQAAAFRYCRSQS